MGDTLVSVIRLRRLAVVRLLRRAVLRRGPVLGRLVTVLLLRDVGARISRSLGDRRPFPPDVYSAREHERTQSYHRDCKEELHWCEHDYSHYQQYHPELDEAAVERLGAAVAAIMPVGTMAMIVVPAHVMLNVVPST